MTFLDQIDQFIKNKHLLNHDFYKAWSEGKLSKECLCDYAKEYYHHVKAFPTYLSALHSNEENSATRKILLQNLIDEEAGSPNHPELWRNFALSLGVTSTELDSHKPSTAMQNLIATFRSLCREHTAAGLPALYAYESQIPAISLSKIEGLKTFYNLTEKDQWEYFTVHIEADKEHAAQEKMLLEDLITPSNFPQAKQATQRALDSLWDFLTSLCHKYQIACVA